MVPAGRWATGFIHLRSKVELHLEEGAEVRFSQNPEDYLPMVLTQRGGIRIHNYSPFIYAHQCHDIAITGRGVLNGQGHTWWPWKFRQPGMRTLLLDIPRDRIPMAERVFGTRKSGVRPVFCQPLECERVLIDGVTFVNSPSWTIQPVACREVTVRYVTVRNPPTRLSHNTDGIDPDACQNVLIDHCHVSTGDDALCIKAGLGPDAWENGQSCENIVISHCVVGNAHGAITIGSEMSGGVKNVRVHHCMIDGADIGIRIKTKPTRGGFIENVTFEDIQMRRIRSHAIDCNLLYDGNHEESLDLDDLRHVPRIDGIRLRNIECSSAPHGMKLQGLPGHPIRNVTMENISIAAREGARILEVENLEISGVQLGGSGDDSSEEVPFLPCVADEIVPSKEAFPAGKRPMAGREAVPIRHDKADPPLILRWHHAAFTGRAARLRFTVAVDHRVAHRVRVGNAVSGEEYGIIEVLFSCPGQVFELGLSPEAAAAALRDGLSLTLTEDLPSLWIVAPGPHACPAILPHLLPEQESEKEHEFRSLFASTASLQPCDWMGICVLDGLADLASLGDFAARKALHHHLAVCFDPVHGTRENMFGEPANDQPGGPESTGPYALLAMLQRTNPALALAEQGFQLAYNPATDAVGDRVVAESAYNVAYPMMAMAVWAGRDCWYERSLRQLEANRMFLADKDDLWLRFCPRTQSRTFQNWSRGVAWYLLGLVRTLALIPEHERPEGLVAEAGRVAAWVGTFQLPGGLWPCFFKEPSTVPDTSGSAGIAAAIALGVNRGIIDPVHQPIALATRQGLADFLTQDGWLRGASQSNKKEAAARDLQRSQYRVVAPWGMGLFAQLLAALDSPR